MTTEQHKQQICEIGRRLWERRLCCCTEGNISVRLDDHQLLATPTGISKGFMSPDDICTVDMAGELAEPNPAGRKPSSELLLHLAIYRSRPDVNAIVHSHPPHVTAFAVTSAPMPTGIYPEAEVFLGRVPLAPYATPGTQQLPDVVTPLIDEKTNSVILANHGSVHFAADLLDAYHKLELLDTYCRIILLAKNLGEPKQLTAEQLSQLTQQSNVAIEKM